MRHLPHSSRFLVGVLALTACVAGVFGQGIPELPILFPAAGAKDVNPDSPIKITLAAAPAPGAGKIMVCDADGKVVATVDAGQATRTQSIGGLTNYVVRPILIDKSEAAIILPPQSLAYGKSYFVKFEGAPLGTGVAANFGEDKHWTFLTKAAPPAADAAKLVVAADGSGDFTTIQGAIDFIPEGNKIPRQIFIRRGTYNEIICIMNRDHLTLLGEDRQQTILAYANNDRFNPNSGGNPFGNVAILPVAQDPKSGPVYRRGLLLAHRCADLVIANMTLHNTTPHGGSQAETIIFNGSADAAHTIFTGLDLYSFQDTFQFNGQVYMSESYVEGDVDFMWGTGPCYFEKIHARAVTNGAYFTTVRNPTTNHGFVYKDCEFDGGPGIMNCSLARAEGARFPTSEDVLLNVSMTNVVSAAGWTAPNSPTVHYWEYNSHTPDGQPVDNSRRQAASKRLTDADDKETLANYMNPAFVLGGKWTPVLAPLIASSTGDVTVKPGGKVILMSQAAGVPAMTYQWQKNGADVAGATSADLIIDAAKAEDAGVYTVVVSNSLGNATSAGGKLTVRP